MAATITTTCYPESFNCAEMKEALLKVGIDGRGLKRAELLACVEKQKQILIEREAEEVAAKEAHRLARVAEQLANPNVVAAHTAIAESFTTYIAGCRETIVKFQKKIAEADVDTNTIASTLEWNTDDVFEASEIISQLVNLGKFFAKQAAEQTLTCQEIMDSLEQSLESVTSDLFRVSTSQSTNPVANVRNICELKAKGVKANALRCIVKYYDEMITDSPRAARYIFNSWF